MNICVYAFIVLLKWVEYDIIEYVYLFLSLFFEQEKVERVAKVSVSEEGKKALVENGVNSYAKTPLNDIESDQRGQDSEEEVLPEQCCRPDLNSGRALL